jgi:urease accessory protein
VLALITQTTGWWSGVLHPVQDLEHLVTMLLVGVLAGLCTASGRSAWWAPLTFVVGLAAGSLIGDAVLVDVELRWVLVVQVAVLAGLLFISARVARTLPLISLGVGLLHGWSHGTALTTALQPTQFLAGSLFTACIVSACGAVVGISIARSVLDRRTSDALVPAPQASARVASRRAA